MKRGGGIILTEKNRVNMINGCRLFQERISNASGQSPYPISSVIKDLPCEGEDDEDDDDDEDDEEEETALEGSVSLSLLPSELFSSMGSQKISMLVSTYFDISLHMYDI